MLCVFYHNKKIKTYRSNFLDFPRAVFCFISILSLLLKEKKKQKQNLSIPFPAFPVYHSLFSFSLFLFPLIFSKNKIKFNMDTQHFPHFKHNDVVDTNTHRTLQVYIHTLSCMHTHPSSNLLRLLKLCENFTMILLYFLFDLVFHLNTSE